MGITNKDQALYLATGIDSEGAMLLSFKSSDTANQKAFQEMMAQYKTFIDKLREVNEGINTEIASLQEKMTQVTTSEERKMLQASIGMLEVMRSKSIPGITEEMNKASLDWNKLFSTVGAFTGETVDEVVGRLQGKVEELKQAGQLTRESYTLLSKSLFPEKDEKQPEDSYYKTFGREILNLFQSIGKGSKEQQTNFEKLGKSATKTFGDVSKIMSGLGNVGKAIGWDQETLNTFTQLSSTLGGAATLAQGLVSGDAASIISGSAQMLAGAISLFDLNTKRADRQIKQHARNIKDLQREYEALGWAVKNALGTDYYALQMDEAENKAKQILEIEGQIAAEESKRRKKKDDEKIKEYEAQKVKLEREIQDIQKSIVEDLMTTNVKSLAANIASAIVDGVASGVDDLDGVVDKKMDQLMRNILKKQFEVNVVQVALKPMFDNAAKYFGEDSEEGFGLSNNELKSLLSDAEEGKKNILAGVDGYLKLLEVLGVDREEYALATTGVSGQLQEAMTEGTASQLVGLWNMTANDIRSMRNLTAEQLTLCSLMNMNVGEVLRQQYLIEYNTRRTADNTAGTVEELRLGFGRLDNRLKTIDENTREYTGRGKR